MIYVHLDEVVHKSAATALAIAISAMVTSCGNPTLGPQGSKGDQGAKGDTGLQGEAGPIGPLGSQGTLGPLGYSSQFRLARATCTNPTDCQVVCSEDEIVILAFCGRRRGAPTYLTERHVYCGLNPNTSDGLIIAVCGK